MAKLAKQDIPESVLKARIKLLLQAPFFGLLATRLNIIMVEGDPKECWLPTAATDNKNLYFNREFISRLNDEEMIFLIGHEILHCVYSHMERRGSRHPIGWNIAADYALNMDLVKQDIGEIIDIPKSEAGEAIKALYDEKYDGMTADEIYELLREETEQNRPDCDECSGTGQVPSDDGEKGSGKADNETKDCPSCSGTGKQPAGGCGSGSGMGGELPEEFDVHIAGDEQTDPTGQNGPVPMTKEEREALKQELTQAVINAVKADQSAGSCPGGVRRMVEALTEPKIDWREVLGASIRSSITDDYSWFTRSKRAGSVIMPGLKNADAVEVVLAIDTSGSISDAELRDFLSEVRGIMEEFDDFELKLFCFDTDTYDIATYTPANLTDLEDFEIAGGGGTDFDVIFKRLEDEEIEPEQLVVLTDGYPCGSWGNESYCDTIFLISSCISQSIEASFGVTLYLED